MYAWEYVNFFNECYYNGETAIHTGYVVVTYQKGIPKGVPHQFICGRGKTVNEAKLNAIENINLAESNPNHIRYWNHYIK